MSEWRGASQHPLGCWFWWDVPHRSLELQLTLCGAPDCVVAVARRLHDAFFAAAAAAGLPRNTDFNAWDHSQVCVVHGCDSGGDAKTAGRVRNHPVVAGCPHTTPLDSHLSLCQAGFGDFQVSQQNGRRADAYATHLKEALGRPNLSVVTGARATKLATEAGSSGARAVGVEYAVGGPGAARQTGAFYFGGERRLQVRCACACHLTS
jgi:choline dehydrogenase-like flavoprotein